MIQKSILEIRSSRLPLALACPASTVAADAPIVGDMTAAALGTAAHRLYTSEIAGVHESAETVAAECGVSAAELGMLFHLGMKCWSQVSQHFPEPDIEVQMEAGYGSLHLTGHADVLSYDEDAREIRLADFKTGRVDEDHQDQLRAYGWLALQELPEAESVYAVVLKVRDLAADAYRWTRQELDAWFAATSDRLHQSGYNPGRHCTYCPRRLECPARTAMLAQAANALTEHGAATASDLLDLYERANQVATLAEQAKDAVRAAVEEAGGRLAADDGRELALVETVKKHIAFEPGYLVLVQAVGHAAANAAIRISKTDAEAAVRAQAPRGQKTRAVMEFLDRLESEGAIQEESSLRLELRRKPLAVTQEDQP